jgi:hypothetical protein
VKTAARILAGLILLALLGWTGIFLYWHLTLRSAIQSFEDHAGEVPRPWDPLAGTEAFDTIRASGCRSLPYLVQAIASSNDPEYQRGLSLLVFFAATKQDSPEANAQLLTVSLLSVDDSPLEHRKKCDAIRNWWKQDGHLYHQWWRVWTSKCGSR